MLLDALVGTDSLSGSGSAGEVGAVGANRSILISAEVEDEYSLPGRRGGAPVSTTTTPSANATARTIRVLETENQTLQTTLARLTLESKEAERALSSKNTEIAKLKELVEDKQRLIETLERSNASLKDSEGHLSTTIEDLNRQLADIRVRQTEIRRTEHTARQKFDLAVDRSVLGLEAENEQLVRELEERKKEAETLKRELAIAAALGDGGHLHAPNGDAVPQRGRMGEKGWRGRSVSRDRERGASSGAVEEQAALRREIDKLQRRGADQSARIAELEDERERLRRAGAPVERSRTPDTAEPRRKKSTSAQVLDMLASPSKRKGSKSPGKDRWVLFICEEGFVVVG